jgi:hypothetical protein
MVLSFIAGVLVGGLLTFAGIWVFLNWVNTEIE